MISRSVHAALQAVVFVSCVAVWRVTGDSYWVWISALNGFATALLIHGLFRRRAR